MDNAIDHYQAVLRDLELRRSRCKQELAELETTINGLKKLISPEASLFVAAPVPEKPEFKLAAVAGARPSAAPVLPFAGMSVRWAILKLLAENTGAQPSAAEIAQALIDGGISVGKSKDFASNVSAVLSDMKNKRTEVANAAGTWDLTLTGHRAWDAIKSTPQYRERTSSAAATLQ